MMTLFILSTTYLQAQPVVTYRDGRLQYTSDSLGNQLTDFSYAGYRSSNQKIPTVKAVVRVPHQTGDQTTRIQKAIDYVSSLPLNENGFRGAVLLEPGQFELSGQLLINASGVVLRGSGTHKDGTTIVGIGFGRATLVRVAGNNDQQLKEKISVSDAFVPVGSISLSVNDISEYRVGDEIVITRPSTKKWIEKLGMENFGGETDYIGWKANERNINWNRTITGIEGNQINIDAPITTALDSTYGGALVSKVNWSGRIQNIGIENLVLESTYDNANPKDEQHRWMAITMENLRDAWVRQVNFKHFAGSAVAIWNTGSRITVEDCKSLNPVSEVGGQRRYAFYTEGQQCLFQRIYSEYAYHDFAVGFMAAGPNAFVECQSYLPYSFSGTIDSWASGVLFDIVNIDGNALRFGNRGTEAQGAGWTAANSMFWQCSAALVDCPAPPTTMNYAYAIWSQFSGNGDWHEANGFLQPRSLFYGQLADRLGKDVWDRAYLLPLNTSATSSPTIEEAEFYINEAYEPRIQLKDWIDQASERSPISVETKKVKSVDRIKDTKTDPHSAASTLNIIDGKLLFGKKLATGNRQTVQWWRGNVRQYDARKASPHVTRYVPGRTGVGYTDDLSESVEILKNRNVGALDHNYGLWYDRRRDDHERVRRMDGEAWAPFYEQPFARSGKESAWDGMSKYDLTSYNHWYWDRLSNFVTLGEENDLVLYHQNYFQHNILEAGGHYADFPWRTANNINNTPFPEPVNYAGDKRIFMAEQFYDVSDPAYKKLHQAYIRQCLNNFKGQSNVIQFISAEYTGPLSFMEFWLDEISAWMKETGEDPIIALSATKDVQDAILNDPIRSKIVDVIDIRYWWYGVAKDGSKELYAPEGGKNLAPRQHARLVKTPKETFESTYKAVLEYKKLSPEKAVIHNTHRSSAFGWAIFFAGGSMMNIPKLDENLLVSVAKMQPVETDNYYLLINKATGERMYYFKNENTFSIDLSDEEGFFQMNWIDEQSGTMTPADQKTVGGDVHLIQPKSKIMWLKKL